MKNGVWIGQDCNLSSIKSEFPYSLVRNVENIYFIETSNATNLPSKTKCAIESAATNNPNRMINVLLTSGSMEKNILDTFARFKNLVFHKINPNNFLEGDDYSLDK